MMNRVHWKKAATVAFMASPLTSAPGPSTSAAACRRIGGLLDEYMREAGEFGAAATGAGLPAETTEHAMTRVSITREWPERRRLPTPVSPLAR